MWQPILEVAVVTHAKKKTDHIKFNERKTDKEIFVKPLKRETH